MHGQSVIVWDLETVPDLAGFAVANDLVGKSDADIREVLGNSWPLACDFKLSNWELRIMRYELTDHEWAAMVPMLPNKPRGVPRVNDRRVLNGIFWVLRSGAPWRDLPQEFGPYTTCYNRFVRWRRAGVSNSTQTPSLP